GPRPGADRQRRTDCQGPGTARGGAVAPGPPGVVAANPGPLPRAPAEAADPGTPEPVARGQRPRPGAGGSPATAKPGKGEGGRVRRPAPPAPPTLRLSPRPKGRL